MVDRTRAEFSCRKQKPRSEQRDAISNEEKRRTRKKKVSEHAIFSKRRGSTPCGVRVRGVKQRNEEGLRDEDIEDDPTNDKNQREDDCKARKGVMRPGTTRQR